MSGVVPEGGLVAFDGGEGFEAYVAGVYRATREVDLDAAAVLYARHAEAHPPGRGETRDHPCLVGRAGAADPMEIGFLRWLVGEGYLVREPVALATLGTRFERGLKPALVVGFEPAEDGSEPAPRGPAPC